MPRIFVSHAAKDENLVEEFVELLQVGVGVHPDDIFCSSLPGMNIPTGAEFVRFIKAQVTNPDLVLLLISPEFLKSHFCQHEVVHRGHCLCRSTRSSSRPSITPTCKGYWQERRWPS